MKKAITVTEAIRNFSDYINRIAYRGESFVLTRGGLKVAEIHASPKGCSAADLRRLLDTLPKLNNVEKREFEKDIKKSRREQNKGKVRDPWELY